ncbi:DUF1513 domain-containing protein [Chitinimonas sp. BJYL2]|uniref:DUF1513 domain-containing protein n=1 Tax=Chitinimonas sp. BJYL2 TaxID=2976696 RepID=UPI0022B44DDA|nr:DUF1513 domain-containing protein [Chitinimonas sp. BJYL2]
MQRRSILRAVAAGSLLVAARPLWAVRGPTPVLLSASWAEDSHWQAGALDGQPIALPARAHVVIPDPRRHGEAIVVARRPGYFLARIDWQRGRRKQLLEIDNDRNLVGHAAFNADGRLLLTAETDERRGQGRLVVRDAVTLRPLRDFPSYGIGPHEMVWLDGYTLAVANGGILTLPETGRLKRHDQPMDPSLAIVDIRDGRLLAEYRLPDPQLSIRHLARCADGTLGAALQFEGQGSAPLLALLREGQFRLLDGAIHGWDALGGYAASVAARGNTLLLSAPRGHRVASWSSDGTPQASTALHKAQGLAALPQGWLVSGEAGQLWQLAGDTLAVQQSRTYRGVHWDNHLTVV